MSAFSSLYVLACKFIEPVVNQMVQRLLGFFFFPCLPCFLAGGLLDKCISLRICIYKIILFLLSEIKYFGLKVFIFTSVLCLQKKKIMFWIAVYCTFQVF